MALAGMRDIRDCLVKALPDDESAGEASPFNAKNESLTLPNFAKDDIRALYGQHSEATGQRFEDSAIDSAWRWTEG
jgi:hypothetical protein